MRCPICGSGAKDTTSGGSGYVSIRCLVDGDFQIDAECQGALFDLAESDRHLVLNAAILKGVSGAAPRITVLEIARIRCARRTCRPDAVEPLVMDR